MLIKQENMLSSPDGYPGNMGVCPRGVGTSNSFSYFTLSFWVCHLCSLSCPPPHYLGLCFSQCH